MSQDGSDGQVQSDGGEQETARQRTTRTWNEMLQELRVAQTGVQVLSGLLLIPALAEARD